MVKVAVAGGSSPTLGHSVVSALLETNGSHTPIILSRKKADDTPASSTAAWPVSGSSSTVETRYVDYESKDSLVASLRDIDTVISVLLIHDTDTFVNTQIRLLHAAEAAGCRRFAPSEFSGPYEMHFKVEFEKQAKLPVWEAVLKSQIDAAIFSNGMFMNYLGIGSPEKGGNRTDALAGFAEGPFLFNLVDCWVDMPVVERDGDKEPSPAVITMTNIRDIGRFVAAAIDLEEPWGKRELGMAGSTLGFDEMVSLIEKYTGRKMEVRPFTKKQLQEKATNAPDGVAGLIEHLECQLKTVCCDGGIPVEPTLNRLCPGVKPMTVEEFLKKYWAEPSGISV